MKSAKLLKRITILLIIFVIIISVLTQSVFSKAKVKKQTYNSKEAKIGDTVKCPVEKSKVTVDKDTKYVKIDGKKYYICCPDCIDKIKKDPDKYLKDSGKKQTFKSKEAKVGDTVICPVKKSKITVDKDTKYVKIDGKKYYVCCPDCIDKIKKDPDKYLKEKSKKKKMKHKHDKHEGSE